MKLKSLPHSLFISLICVFIFFIILGGGVAEQETKEEDSADGSSRICEELLQEMEKGDPVEALVMLEEKADTAAASQAVRNYARPFADGERVKSMVRHAVVGTLKNTAEETQAPLLEYLEEQEEKGNVLDIDDFFIVNSLYVEAKPAVIKELSRESGVEKVYPNFEVEPLQEENLETGSSLV